MTLEYLTGYQNTPNTTPTIQPQATQPGEQRLHLPRHVLRGLRLPCQAHPRAALLGCGRGSGQQFGCLGELQGLNPGFA